MVKRVLTVFVLVMGLVMFSSPLIALASCDLDTTRWKWINSDSRVGLFYDTMTIRFLSNGLVECWVCNYYPNGCDNHSYEHYHYGLMRINYNDNSYGVKSHVHKDMKGNTIDRYTFDDVKYSPIFPSSVSETIAMGIKNDYRL